MNKYLKHLDSFMAILFGMAVGAAISIAVFPVVPLWAGYLCATGLVTAEYWQNRFIQNEIAENYDLMYLKAAWEDTKE